ncbi:MAG TPA: SRPBCC family protein [Chloroflexota bacterium]|nr:SRPBCC family protein [Chloroflexota bacterium]
MPEIVNQAIIRAPAEQIFAFIEQAERNVEWVPDLTSSERLTPGPTSKGSRFRFAMRVAGIPVESTDEVVEYEPGRLIRFSSVRGVPHAGYWRFEPQPPASDGRPQTLVTYGMSFELPPGVGPLVARMIDLPRRMDEQSRACLANLRRILE